MVLFFLCFPQHEVQMAKQEEEIVQILFVEMEKDKGEEE
jgi:hypothetical protein